jgi:hypothetical protein
MGLIADSTYDEATKRHLARVLEGALAQVRDKPAVQFPGEPYLSDILERSILELYAVGQTDQAVLERYAAYCALAYSQSALSDGRIDLST